MAIIEHAFLRNALPHYDNQQDLLDSVIDMHYFAGHLLGARTLLGCCEARRCGARGARPAVALHSAHFAVTLVTVGRQFKRYLIVSCVCTANLSWCELTGILPRIFPTATCKPYFKD